MSRNYLELYNANKLYEKLLEISDDGFLMVDKNGEIIEINKTYCDYLGVQKEDVLYKHVLNVVYNSKLPEFLKTNKKEIAVPHKLIKGQSKEEEKYVIVSRSSVMFNGEIIGAVGQIKFSKHTVQLANKLKNLDDELNFYKEELKRITNENKSFIEVIGRSKNFLIAKKCAERSAETEFNVLLEGETGTGKEVFANIIHYSSKRKNNKIIKVNCAAIPSEMFESELFGYEEGAFTGARKSGKKGKFELADGGTIFLDEIGELPMFMQAKLLRILQEKKLDVLGSEKTRDIDVRIIAATNKDLMNEVNTGKFRKDLYYRLNVINIKLPPLRERRDDIELFIYDHLSKLNSQYNTSCIITEKAINIMKNYRWPGNIRELINVVNTSYNNALGEIITPDTLPYMFFEDDILHNTNNFNLKEMIDNYERQLIKNCIDKNNLNIDEAAKELGVHRSTLYKKVNKYNII